MKDLQTIIKANTERQIEHLERQIELAKKFCEDGFTMDLYGNMVKRESGFVVGVLQLDAKELQKIAFQAFNPSETDYLLNTFFVGGWKDSKDGKFYLDLVVIEDKLNSAIDMAKLANQKAIYSFKDSEVIYV